MTFILFRLENVMVIMIDDRTKGFVYSFLSCDHLGNYWNFRNIVEK